MITREHLKHVAQHLSTDFTDAFDDISSFRPALVRPTGVIGDDTGACSPYWSLTIAVTLISSCKSVFIALQVCSFSFAGD